jgi:hypothetical protein
LFVVLTRVGIVIKLSVGSLFAWYAYRNGLSAVMMGLSAVTPLSISPPLTGLSAVTPPFVSSTSVCVLDVDTKEVACLGLWLSIPSAPVLD